MVQPNPNFAFELRDTFYRFSNVGEEYWGISFHDQQDYELCVYERKLLKVAAVYQNSVFLRCVHQPSHIKRLIRVFNDDTPKGTVCLVTFDPKEVSLPVRFVTYQQSLLLSLGEVDVEA